MHFFHLLGSVNKLLHFCVPPLLLSKNSYCSLSHPCCSWLLAEHEKARVV